MKQLITALVLAAAATTAQADQIKAAFNSIKGQDFAAMNAQCNTVSDDPISHTLTEQDRKVVENAVKEQLKDPESAKFSNISVVSLRDVCKATTPYKDLKLNHSTMKWEVITKTQRDSKPIIKGLVNAKNSYGGYTGTQQFTLYENLKIQF
jgi:predicted phage-related endonuclease